MTALRVVDYVSDALGSEGNALTHKSFVEEALASEAQPPLKEI